MIHWLTVCWFCPGLLLTRWDQQRRRPAVPHPLRWAPTCAPTWWRTPPPWASRGYRPSTAMSDTVHPVSSFTQPIPTTSPLLPPRGPRLVISLVNRSHFWCTPMFYHCSMLIRISWTYHNIFCCLRFSVLICVENCV